MKSLILKEVNRFTVILIYMFGIYIILHGHLSPGGGFAGGTIISAGLILYHMVYPERSNRVLSDDTVMKAICGALLVYGSIKSYHILHGILVTGHHAKEMAPYSIAGGGTLLILNTCVGIIVAGTFFSVTKLFLKGDQ